MLKVVIQDSVNLDDSGKVFFCDAVKVYETGKWRFCLLINKRAKVKTSQIPLNWSQCVSVTEDK